MAILGELVKLNAGLQMCERSVVDFAGKLALGE